MNSFWKNEMDLFEKDMIAISNFLLQPVTITTGFESNLMLKPSSKEIVEKAETTSFWKNEWKLFEKEYDSAMDFLMQPISFK